MKNKIDGMLERAGLTGEVAGEMLRKILTRQFMIIAGVLVIVIFGSIAFLQGVFDGAAKKN